MIRVLLVDDHASFRQPLAFMLERESEINVVAQAGSLAEAREVIEGVDVAIVDLDLPDGSGVDLIGALRAANPNGMVLILSGSTDRALFARAVEEGASGVMNKSSRIAEIVEAVQRLSAGEPLISPREMIEMLRYAGRHREENRTAQQTLQRLTPREREVLQSLADGLNDKEIAQRLHVSTETARTHMVNVLRKLDVDSRLQALVFAVRHGAVTIR